MGLLVVGKRCIKRSDDFHPGTISESFRAAVMSVHATHIQNGPLDAHFSPAVNCNCHRLNNDARLLHMHRPCVVSTHESE